MNRTDIAFETENLTVRSIREDDKDRYIALRKEASNIAEAYKVFEGLPEEEWKDIVGCDEDLFLMAFSKKDGRLAACSSFQFIESDDLEIGIDVAKAFRNKGVATELMTEMVRIARDVFPGKKIILKTERNNIACRRATEKVEDISVGTSHILIQKSWMVYLAMLIKNGLATRNLSS